MSKFFYVFALSGLIVLSSCSEDDKSGAVYSNAYPIILKADASSFETDKTYNPFSKGEMIGISMLEENSENVVEPYKNVGYSADGIGGYFVAENKDIIPCLPENGEKRDVFAYYPFDKDITDAISVDIRENQELALKLQYGRQNGLDKDNRKAELKMRNAMSMISVTIDPSAITGLTDVSVEVLNTPLVGNMNILNGKFDTSETGNISMKSYGDTEGTNSYKYFAMIFPNTTKSKSENSGITEEIRITVNFEAGDVKTITIPANDYITVLPESVNTNFDITLDENAVPTIKVTSGNFNIGDWIENGNIDVDGNETMK